MISLVFFIIRLFFYDFLLRERLEGFADLTIYERMLQ